MSIGEWSLATSWHPPTHPASQPLGGVGKVVLWFVLPSILLLSSGTLTVASTNDALNEVQRVVQQLLGVSHLRVEVGSDV